MHWWFLLILILFWYEEWFNICINKTLIFVLTMMWRIAIKGELMLHCEKLIGARWDKSNSPVQLVQAFALFQLDSSGGGDNKGYQDSREICRIKCSMLQLIFCGIKISPSSNHDRYYKILLASIEKAGWVEVAWGPSGLESHRTPHSPDLAPGPVVIWIYINVVSVSIFLFKISMGFCCPNLIHRKVWLQIFLWCQNFSTNIQHLYNPM